MKQKTVDCLELTAMPMTYTERQRFYTEISNTYSIIAVRRKIQELIRRGCVVATNGTDEPFNPLDTEITPKGKELLETI